MPQSGWRQHCIVCTSHHVTSFWGHGLHYGQCPQHVCSSPALCGGYVPFDYGGFFCTPPSTTSVTTIMAMAALLRIMGGIRLSNFPHWCMGGIKLLLGMYPCLCTAVHPFPRAMGGIPMRLHQLPQTWCLRACCITLLCCRTITIPPLGLTLPCHFPALAKASFLLSCTIPVHLPPCPVLLPPLLLRGRCSSST